MDTVEREIDLYIYILMPPMIYYVRLLGKEWIMAVRILTDC